MWKAYIVIGAALLLLLPLYFLLLRRKVKTEKLQKIISVVLFLSVIATLYYENAIDSIVKLQSYYFTPFIVVFMVLLRWFTSVVTACAIFYPFYPNKYFKKIVEYILPLVAILNFIFIANICFLNNGINLKSMPMKRGFLLLVIHHVIVQWIAKKHGLIHQCTYLMKI